MPVISPVVHPEWHALLTGMIVRLFVILISTTVTMEHVRRLLNGLHSSRASKRIKFTDKRVLIYNKVVLKTVPWKVPLVAKPREGERGRGRQWFPMATFVGVLHFFKNTYTWMFYSFNPPLQTYDLPHDLPFQSLLHPFWKRRIPDSVKNRDTIMNKISNEQKQIMYFRNARLHS